MAPQAAVAGTTDQDWNVAPATKTLDWGADEAEGEWGNADPKVGGTAPRPCSCPLPSPPLLSPSPLLPSLSYPPHPPIPLPSQASTGNW